MLTDLESTNGTKVNGEDIQLRILRHGDLISVGRSVLLYGSREQIDLRLAQLRGDPVGSAHTLSGKESESGSVPDAGDFDANWSESSEIHETLHSLEPPEVPQQLSPAQAAQFGELLEYLHVRIRELLESVKMKADGQRVTLELQAMAESARPAMPHRRLSAINRRPWPAPGRKLRRHRRSGRHAGLRLRRPYFSAPFFSTL